MEDTYKAHESPRIKATNVAFTQKINAFSFHNQYLDKGAKIKINFYDIYLLIFENKFDGS